MPGAKDAACWGPTYRSMHVGFWGMNARTRVAIVDDHAVVVEALRMSLDLKGFETVDMRPASADVDALVRSVVAAQADVVLLDLQLGPAGDGKRLIPSLVRQRQRVVVLTGISDRARWGACLAAGAVGVLPKTAHLQVIVDAVQRAAQGVPVVSPRLRQDLLQVWQARSSVDDDRRRRLSRLTPRESDVLLQLIHGKRVREVAKEAFVSEATVRTQVKSILAKLGVNSQLAAVALARDAGWAASMSRARREGT